MHSQLILLVPLLTTIFAMPAPQTQLPRDICIQEGASCTGAAAPYCCGPRYAECNGDGVYQWVKCPAGEVCLTGARTGQALGCGHPPI